MGDQTKRGRTNSGLNAGDNAVVDRRNVTPACARYRQSDMEPGLRELTALSLLAAFCCGLAWAHEDTFFAAVFGGATAITIIEAIRRSRGGRV